jgi:hypothetical protein
MSRGYSHRATSAAEAIPHRAAGCLVWFSSASSGPSQSHVCSSAVIPGSRFLTPESEPGGHFDGLFTVTFGFVLTIGVVLLIANVADEGITCPRCGKWNPKRASIGETCQLRLRPSSPTRYSAEEPLPAAEHHEPLEDRYVGLRRIGVQLVRRRMAA